MTVRLEHSERLHRFLVEQSPDIIYTLDKNGVFIFVNGRVQALLGYSREELLGKHYSLIVHPDDQEHARFAFNERRIGDRASTNVEIGCRPRPTASGISRTGPSSPSSVPKASMPPMKGRPPALHGHLGRRAGHHRPQEGRGNHRLPGLSRSAHRTAQPDLFKDRLGVALKQAKRKASGLG
jgi:PAS domain S-box-containing protein